MLIFTGSFVLSFSNGGVRSGPLVRGIELDLEVAPAGGGRWSVLMGPPSTCGILNGAPRGAGGGLLKRPGLLVVGRMAWLSIYRGGE